MTEIGRVYVKTAGRESGKFCTIIEPMDENFVLIDGEVRRKRCNLAHLEPLEKTVDLKKGASHADVVKAFEKIGIKIVATKSKTKKGIKPVRQRKQKQAKAPEQRAGKTAAAEKKVEKKQAKKEAKK